MAPQEPPLLIISSSAHTFDPDQLAQWTEEGYRVHYVSGAGVELFADLAEEVESCDGYGIIGQ